MFLTDAIGAAAWDAAAKDQFANFFDNLLVGRLGNSAALVLAADGADRDAAGVSLGISNHLDRCFLVTLRNRSSMVITTGATVRTEGLHFPSGGRLGLLSKQEALLVPRITGSGHISRAAWATQVRGETSATGWYPPLCVSQEAGNSLESQDIFSLNEVEAEANLHFEAGLKTLVQLWDAGLIHQLWVSHWEGADLERNFRHAHVTHFLRLDSLVLSLLQPRLGAASL